MELEASDLAGRTFSIPPATRWENTTKGKMGDKEAAIYREARQRGLNADEAEALADAVQARLRGSLDDHHYRNAQRLTGSHLAALEFAQLRDTLSELVYSAVCRFQPSPDLALRFAKWARRMDARMRIDGWKLLDALKNRKLYHSYDDILDHADRGLTRQDREEFFPPARME